MWRVPSAAPFQSIRPASRISMQQTNCLGEFRPLICGRGGGGEFGNSLDCIVLPNAVEEAGGSFWANTLQKLNGAEPREAVRWILCPAQECQHVLNVGGFQKFQAAELPERDVAAGELDLKRAAVMRSAEQNRLRLQRNASFSVFKHHFCNIEGLIGFVAHVHELG